MEVLLHQSVHFPNIHFPNDNFIHKPHRIFFQKFGNLCKVYAHSEDNDKKQTREKVIRKEQVSTEDLERTLYDCVWNTHYDNGNQAWTVDLQCVQLI